jgi:hypothetical protein
MPKSIHMIQPSDNSISYLILQDKHVMDSNLTAYAKCNLDCHPDIFFEPSDQGRKECRKRDLNSCG